ncbi:hypothetical protein [Shouchella miscanthi]|uniref:defense against restriction DarA-related protein n=1 Tax=Shouchella miscanthi TaxID=2598861 RepID=UPI0016438629|nr:hypothetical protein [Shouchella miscanthi]
MLLRPPAPGCQPIHLEEMDYYFSKWGEVAYDRLLTEEELAEYEMKRIFNK